MEKRVVKKRFLYGRARPRGGRVFRSSGVGAPAFGLPPGKACRQTERLRQRLSRCYTPSRRHFTEKPSPDIRGGASRCRRQWSAHCTEPRLAGLTVDVLLLS